MSKIILMLQSYLVGSCPIFSTVSDFSEIVGFNLMEGFIFEAFAFSEQWEDFKNAIEKYKNCIYSLLMNTFTGKAKCVTLDAAPALSPYTFQSVNQNFIRMLLRPETVEIFHRKPDRHLIIYVLEDTGTIPI